MKFTVATVVTLVLFLIFIIGFIGLTAWAGVIKTAENYAVKEDTPITDGVANSILIGGIAALVIAAVCAGFFGYYYDHPNKDNTPVIIA